MTGIIGYFLLLIVGSAVIVLALNASYWTGRRYEEKQSRRYLDSLTHLHSTRNRE
jgi:membrane protein DedA with SNARE-associated domain